MRPQLRLAWIVAAAFVLVGGVAAFLFEHPPGAVAPSNSVATTGRGKNVEPNLPASDREPAPTAEPSVEKPAEAEPSERAPIEEELGVDVALVDAMTRKPRDDATAWYVDPAADEADRRKFWHQSDPLVEHCGVALDVDKEAHVRLPALPEVEVVARAADRFGRASIRRSGGEKQRLLLWPDSPLTVRVVDGEGRPCGGLPVVLDVVYLSDEGRERARASFLPPDLNISIWRLLKDRAVQARIFEAAQRLTNAEHEGLWSGTTSKQGGEAEVPRGAMLIVRWSDPDLVARSTALRFRLALPTTDAATALVDPQMDLHQPVVLVAPTFVKLRVSVVGPDDRPFPCEVRLTSRLAAKKAEEHHDDPTDPIARLVATKRKKALETREEEPLREPPTGEAVSIGVVPIEMLVPASASVEIDAEPVDSRFKPAKAIVTAPSSPDVSGDVVVKIAAKVATTTTKRTPRVLGRALDPDGRPLADERLGWQNVDPRHSELVHVPGAFVRADHGGRFVIPFPPPLYGRSVKIRLLAPCPAEGSGLDATMAAEVVLGDPDRDADLDLGDVSLRRLPLLISGRVVDPEGHGLPHPTITLWAGSSGFRDSSDAMVVAGSLGRFEIHGDPDEASLLVSAELDGWYLPGTTVGAHGEVQRPRRRFPVGSSDVQIELHRCGVARGELLLDPSADPSAISLETLPHLPAVRLVRDEGSRFRLIGIPGLCDLAARGSGHCLLVLVDRIELREAATTDDPRIQPLDMSGVVRMPIVVVDPRGAPIPEARLVLSSNSEDARAPRVFHADPFGREVIVAVQNDGPLLVGATGLRVKRELLESIPKTITLAPGIAVSVSLQGLADVPSQVTARISAHYRPARGDSPALQALLDGLVCSSAERPARDAKLDLFLSAPGTWSLFVTLADPDRKTEEYFPPEPRIATVEEAGEAQHLDLRIPDALLRGAMERLER